MASEFVKEIQEDNFNAEIAKGVTLVDFSADWCGPCRMLTPILDQVAQELKDKAKIVKINVDNAQQIASQFQVTSVPTMILFKDGKKVGSLVGLRDAAALKEFILSAT